MYWIRSVFGHSSLNQLTPYTEYTDHRLPITTPSYFPAKYFINNSFPFFTASLPFDSIPYHPR